MIPKAKETNMKTIKLTQNKVALVDDADYKRLNQFKWYYNEGYAVRASKRDNGKRPLISMTREILGLNFGDKRQADHINHDKLDNRRENLRICTKTQNGHNRLSQQSTSKFKGIYWNKRAKKWFAQIKIDGNPKYLGLFKMEELAALAYDIAAMQYHNEFVQLNFN